MADETLPLLFEPRPRPIATKRCKRCRKTKQLSEFHWRSDQNRHRADCIECYNAIRTSRRDHEDNRRRVREWQKANPEKRSAASKRRHERIRGDLTRWLASNLRGTRAYCKRRDVECTITAEQARWLYEQQAGRCAISGRILIYGSKGQQRDSISYDRIEHGGGYVLENVRLVTYQANMARGPFSDEELRDFCVAHLETIGYTVSR